MNLAGPVKSVIISGNLQNEVLTYKLCPSSEFSDGVWNICILSLGYTCNENDVSEICEVTCNLVKSQKYNHNSEVESYDQPFSLFLLDSTNSRKKCLYFGDYILFKLLK